MWDTYGEAHQIGCMFKNCERSYLVLYSFGFSMLSPCVARLEEQVGPYRFHLVPDGDSLFTARQIFMNSRTVMVMLSPLWMFVLEKCLLIDFFCLE